MNIRRNIQFALKRRTYKGNKLSENLPIRMRVSYNCQRIDIMMGYFVNECDWDPAQQRVKKNTVGKNGAKASTINADLNKAAYEMDEVFKEFELLDRYPKPDEVEDTFNRRMARKAPKPTSKAVTRFWEAFNIFKAEESAKNSWQNSTVQKFNALAEHIKRWKEPVRFEDFNERGFTSFITFLLTNEGLSNDTTLKQLAYLKWFLRWARNFRYHDTSDFEYFRPKLAYTKKKIIFLTIEEIRKLLAYEIPESKAYLQRVRDVFVFCCFTSLRHSDVYNLRRSDVKDDHIEITTKKTADTLSIDLNDVARGILDKYKDVPFPGNKALPVISNQKMNDYLKELCELAGFDEEIHITTYQGAERIDTVYPKYALIGTHQGRKSFICNALAAGIPVNVVMKWTGHSDYKAMKPYIDVADTIRAWEMNKMNNLL